MRRATAPVLAKGGTRSSNTLRQGGPTPISGSSRQPAIVDAKLQRFGKVIALCCANGYVREACSAAATCVAVDTAVTSSAAVNVYSTRRTERIPVQGMGPGPTFKTAVYHGTRLHVACARGWHDRAAVLLSRGAHTEVRDSNGATPLLTACRIIRDGLVPVAIGLSTIQVLLSKGARIDACYPPGGPSAGDTAVHVAAAIAPDQGGVEVMDTVLGMGIGRRRAEGLDRAMAISSARGRPVGRGASTASTTASRISAVARAVDLQLAGTKGALATRGGAGASSAAAGGAASVPGPVPAPEIAIGPTSDPLNGRNSRGHTPLHILMDGYGRAGNDVGTAHATRAMLSSLLSQGPDLNLACEEPLAMSLPVGALPSGPAEAGGRVQPFVTASGGRGVAIKGKIVRMITKRPLDFLVDRLLGATSEYEWPFCGKSNGGPTTSAWQDVARDLLEAGAHIGSTREETQVWARKAGLA